MAIIKKAKNINIQVANNYTSLSKVSHEESEEIVIEATKQNLELSSQKKAILQELGEDGMIDNEDIEKDEKKCYCNRDFTEEDIKTIFRSLEKQRK